MRSMGDYLDVEEVARMVGELKENAREARDQTFNQSMVVVERRVIDIATKRFQDLIEGPEFVAI
jgi:hypothetical protein